MLELTALLYIIPSQDDICLFLHSFQYNHNTAVYLINDGLYSFRFLVHRLIHWLLLQDSLYSLQDGLTIPVLSLPSALDILVPVPWLSSRLSVFISSFDHYHYIKPRLHYAKYFSSISNFFLNFETLHI